MTVEHFKVLILLTVYFQDSIFIIKIYIFFSPDKPTHICSVLYYIPITQSLNALEIISIQMDQHHKLLKTLLNMAMYTFSSNEISYQHLLCPAKTTSLKAKGSCLSNKYGRTSFVCFSTTFAHIVLRDVQSFIMSFTHQRACNFAYAVLLSG